MAFTKDPPITLTALLRRMREDTDIFIPRANPTSTRAIASRLSVDGRHYRTSEENDGMRVWRLPDGPQ